MAFPSEFLDELKFRVGLVSTVSKYLKISRKGKEHQGLCPFHKEKTPSFTVNENKGFYHCFGCGAHGSIFDFVMEIDGITFPEAVEKLAHQAGMEIPKLNQFEQEKEKRLRLLADICELATTYFQKMLRDSRGTNALNYLTERGVNNETIEIFRLGFAPNDRDGFKKFSIHQGFGEDDLIEAGMLIKPDKSWANKNSYDRFRGRVIFPITNRRDQVVAFGGRVLQEGEPKYLNSPETPLFSKGRSLYGLYQVLRANRKRDKVIVVEGYMDVIMLHQAGFKGAVAPLGTALTEQQLIELWRVSPEPVFCFDGDAAGGRAAARAANRALSIIKAGQGLLFSKIPKNQDPDSLIQGSGVEAFTLVLNESVPLSEVLWQIETKGQYPVTPEAKAMLQKKFNEYAKSIKDHSFKKYFIDHFENRIKGRGTYRDFVWGSHPKERTNYFGERKDFKRTLPQIANFRREQVLLATLINHPELFGEFEEIIGRLEFSVRDLDILRQQVLKTLAQEDKIDSLSLVNDLIDHQQGKLLSAVLSDDVYIHAGFARAEKTLDEARQGWLDTYRLYNEEHLQLQIKLTEQALLDNPSSEVMDRLRALKEQQPV
ncbi:MAG: DNA primase [Magnetovibrio sp.]|nr:DNA primase [Magnetovibrio sp.]